MALVVDIRKRLGTFELDISFELDEGDGTLGLLGASGCGKSLTLRCIAGIERPDEGRIVLDGRVLFDSAARVNLSPQERGVGYLFQQYALFPHMSVAQNVAVGLAGLNRADCAARVDELLRAMRLEDLRDRYPRVLSGGQQQRCAMARMLAAHPKVLLLDEPFSALDGYLRWQLELEVSDVLAGYGGRAVLVSHDRDEIYRLCDTVCVLDEGRSDPKTTVTELFAQPTSLGAALISGCKNVSRARAEGADMLVCEDWGVRLRCESLVPDGVTHAGIRAHYLTTEGTENALACRVERVIDSTFSTIVMLSTPGGALLRYELAKEAWRALGDPSQLTLYIAPEQVMPLTKGGRYA